MSDFEDESTSESKNESDFSDSSEYAHEQQYQVRTDSNIQTLLLKETVNQNATKCALLADETATTSGEEHVAPPQKYLKSKKYLQRAKHLHQNWFLKMCNTPKGIRITWWRNHGIRYWFRWRRLLYWWRWQWECFFRICPLCKLPKW